MTLSFLGTALNWLLDDALGLVDKVISWIFYLVPNDFFLSDINGYITDFFSFLFDICSAWQYWIDFAFLSWLFFLTFWLELTYLIIRLILWTITRFIKL